MAAPFSLILRKLENAVVKYLTTFNFLIDPTKPLDPLANPLCPIACGKASTIKTLPQLIVVYAESAKVRPDEEFSGNSDVTLHVMVKYNLATDAGGTDPLAASDALTAGVFDAMLPGDPGDDHALADLLNQQAIADFTAMNNQKIGEEA